MFFLVSRNPLALPTLYVTFNPNQSFSFYEHLLVTEHRLLENCEPGPGYSFQTCVQQVVVTCKVKKSPFPTHQNLESRVGCNLPWSESIGKKEERKCDTFQKYRFIKDLLFILIPSLVRVVSIN